MGQRNTSDAILAKLDKLIEQGKLTNAMLAGVRVAQPLTLAYDWEKVTIREPDKTIAAWEFVPKALYREDEEA